MISAVAGVVGATAAIVFGLVPLLRDRRKALTSSADEVNDRGVMEPSGVLLPAPVLDVQVRGRDDVVAELTELASAPDGRVQVLAGMGGSGKSTVASAAAAWAIARGGRAWWVPAADAVSVTQLLLGLAGNLGASAGQVDDALSGRVNPSDVLWRQLEATQGWMLVLDNADDLDALTVGGRSAGSGAGWLRSTRAGLVLVTSRASDRQAWGPVTDVQRLHSLGDADGAQVLLDLAPAAGDRDAAESLAGRLGGLPLALRQAGSYLASAFAAEPGFAGYERALSVRFAELMGRGEDDRGRVIATWELSLEALEAQGKAEARPLLRVLSCFASTVLVPSLLLDRDGLAAMSGSISGVEEGLAGLLSVGLIDAPDVSGSRVPGVKVHPLVAQTIRYRAGEALTGSLAGAVKLLTATISQLKVDDPEHAPDWLALLPHLQALLLVDRHLPAGSEAFLVEATAQMSLALLWAGSYTAALAVAESGLEREHGLDVNHQAVLGLRLRLASARRYLGRYTEADAEYRKVLDAELRVLGPDHPDTLATRYEIARMLADQGKAAEAEAEFRQVLDARHRVLGPDHPATLTTRHAVARMLADQKMPGEAEAEFRQVLNARHRVLGSDHPDTLTTRHEIARTLADQGKPEAEAEFRQVFDVRLRVLGPDHPATLATRHNIARTLADQGKTGEAEAEFRQVLNARYRVLGSDHPDTLTTRSWLDLLQRH
jgi:tetratricopeptide (TPR) repeat protein